MKVITMINNEQGKKMDLRILKTKNTFLSLKSSFFEKTFKYSTRQ